MNKPQPSFRIRPITVSDVPQFLILFRDTVFSIPDYSKTLRQHFINKYRPEIVIKRINDNAAYSLVAIEKQKLVGFIWGTKLAPTDDGVYWMSWIGVSSDARERGVGRALMNRLERDIRKNLFHKIWINIDPKNKRSAAFFRSLGYRKIAKVKHHWYAHDAVLWEKDIWPKRRGM